MRKQEVIKIEMLNADPSIQCIYAIQQVMDHFNGVLSASGKDRRAVYAWFMERHNPGVSAHNFNSESC